MLVPVIPVAILVRFVAIVTSPHGLATLRAGLGVALLLEQIPELLLVLDGGADPDLLVVDAAAGSVDGNIQVVSSQTCDELHHSLSAVAQAGCNIGADIVWPAPLLPRRLLVHLEEQLLDGYAHLGLNDALGQLVHVLSIPI